MRFSQRDVVKARTITYADESACWGTALVAQGRAGEPGNAGSTEPVDFLTMAHTITRFLAPLKQS